MDERASESIEMARPVQPDRAPTTYAPAESPISRRSFRILMALTLLNTVLLGGYVLGPAFHTFGKQQWAAYQQRKADRKAAEALAAKRAAAMAVERAALTYVAPPATTLVYDDDPARRGSATGAATQPTGVAPWPAVVPQPAAYLSLPAVVPQWGQLVNPAHSVLFMGERRASASSEPRLVIVVCEPFRGFIALTLRPTSSQSDLAVTAYTSQNWRPAKGPPGDPRPAPSLRLFAGHPDPKDASRLLISYELAGTRGVLTGHLQADDTVQLTPDGTLISGWTFKSSRTGL
jgi:hypothetical protein